MATHSMQRRWTNVVYVAPYLLMFSGLLVYPLLAALWLSLHKADFFGGSRLVWLENFTRLFGDAVFLRTVWNTLYFNVLTVPALAAIGLGLALALNRSTRGAAILRGIFFASSVLSVTIVTLLWRVMFLPDGVWPPLAKLLKLDRKPSDGPTGR